MTGTAAIACLLFPLCQQLHHTPQIRAATHKSRAPQLRAPSSHAHSESSPLCPPRASAGMPAPPQHVAEAWNAAEFYSNKLLQELRGVDDVQVAWLRAVKVCTCAYAPVVRCGEGKKRHNLLTAQSVCVVACVFAFGERGRGLRDGVWCSITARTGMLWLLDAYLLCPCADIASARRLRCIRCHVLHRLVQELFLGFQAFVSANCPGGLPWSASGSSMLQAKAALDASSGSSVSAGSKSAAAATPAGPKPPPPPPPPPPPGLLLQPRQAPASGPQAAAPGPAAGGMQEVLKALNKARAIWEQMSAARPRGCMPRQQQHKLLLNTCTLRLFHSPLCRGPLCLCRAPASPVVCAR